MALPDMQGVPGLPLGLGGAAPPEAEDVEVALESLGQWQLAWRRFKLPRLATVGLVIFGFMVAMAVFGPIIDPYNPLFIPNAHKAGGDPPSLAHLFGTDNVGRDVLSMVVNGARISGAVGVFSLILIFGLLSWPLIARLVRAMFLTLREADFVEAARAVGVSDIRITFRHILPSALGPVIVAMTLIMASNIVLEAFVSFLNFGLTPAQTSWGNALSNAQTVL